MYSVYDNIITTYIDNKIKKVREDIAAINGKNDTARKKNLQDIFKRLESLKTQCTNSNNF